LRRSDVLPPRAQTGLDVFAALAVVVVILMMMIAVLVAAHASLLSV